MRRLCFAAIHATLLQDNMVLRKGPRALGAVRRERRANAAAGEIPPLVPASLAALLVPPDAVPTLGGWRRKLCPGISASIAANTAVSNTVMLWQGQC